MVSSMDSWRETRKRGMEERVGKRGEKDSMDGVTAHTKTLTQCVVKTGGSGEEK